MSHGDGPEGCAIIVMVGGCLLLALWATQEFGFWPWLIGGAGIYFWIQNSNKEKERQDAELNRQREAQPCTHGTVGAKRDSTRCPTCVRDRQIAAETARIEAQRIVEEQRRAEVALRSQLRNKDFLRQMDPIEFERVVLMLYRVVGYDAQPTPTTGDQGIDGFLRRGNELVLLQCKRVQSSVGQPVVRDLYGNIKHHHAQTNNNVLVSGLLVTTGRVSRQAREWIADKPIKTVEIDQLVDLFEQHLGLANIVPDHYVTRAAPSPPRPARPARTARTPRRGDCPICGNQLRRVAGRNGIFYGCSGYPACRYTESRV